MRHVYIRGILSLIWLGVAIANGLSRNFETTVLYAILGGALLYSAYAAWKKEKDCKGGRAK